MTLLLSGEENQLKKAVIISQLLRLFDSLLSFLTLHRLLKKDQHKTHLKVDEHAGRIMFLEFLLECSNIVDLVAMEY